MDSHVPGLREQAVKMNGSRRYETLLVTIMFFTWGTVFLDRMSGLYLAPFIAREFQLTNEQIGLLASALAITWAFSTLLFGALSDRVGRKVILVPAVVAFSLLSWFSGLARNFHELLLIRALMGVAEGPCWSVMHAILEQSSHPSRRGRNVGAVVSATALVGLTLAPILSTQIAVRFGWRLAFFVAGIPGLIMALLIWRYVREPARISNGSSHRINLRGLLVVLKYRNVWLSCLAAVGFMSWLFLQNIFAPVYIIEIRHQTAQTAGFLLGASGLGSFFLGFLLPMLSDRIGRKPVLFFMAVLSAASPLILLTPGLYSQLWLMAALLFLTNAGQAIAALSLVLIPAETVPALVTATGIGVTNLVGEIFGATVVPVVGGAMAERHGLAITMWMSVAGMAVVMLSALFMKETESIRETASIAEIANSSQRSVSPD
jgi:predicted MFS family arabinose efflux permease